MRFDDLRRWKCGSLMETLRWSGIHIPGLEQPVDVNGDGVNDYYFTEGEVASAPAAYKNIAVRVNQDGVGLYAEANAVSGYIWSTRPVRATATGIPTDASTSIRFPPR